MLPQRYAHLSDTASTVGLVYGYDRPFIDAEYLGDESEPLDLPIEYGLQGGHHIDISLRFIGSIDPDLVDLSMALSVDIPLHERFYGTHQTEAWYLLFAEEREPDGCYFHRARVFLFDDTGIPVQAWGVEELDGSLADLDITLSTGEHEHHWRARGRLRDASRE